MRCNFPGNAYHLGVFELSILKDDKKNVSSGTFVVIRAIQVRLLQHTLVLCIIIATCTCTTLLIRLDSPKNNFYA